MKPPTLPNFFIAGAPKAGTTSLYHYLGQHPEIYMSPIKEPNYFASEIRLGQFSEHLRPRAEQDLAPLRAYLNGPMREKRFGSLISEWPDYLRTRAKGHRRSQRLLPLVGDRCSQHPPQCPECADHPGFAQSSGNRLLHVLTHLEKRRHSWFFSRGN
jgi:hypothetical protein